VASLSARSRWTCVPAGSTVTRQAGETFLLLFRFFKITTPVMMFMSCQVKVKFVPRDEAKINPGTSKGREKVFKLTFD